MNQRQIHYVVTESSHKGTEGPDVEVRVRRYWHVPPCPTCGQPDLSTLNHDCRQKAAYNDGLAFGQLVREKCVGTFAAGLRKGLGQ